MDADIDDMFSDFELGKRKRDNLELEKKVIDLSLEKVKNEIFDLMLMRIYVGEVEADDRE